MRKSASIPLLLVAAALAGCAVIPETLRPKSADGAMFAATPPPPGKAVVHFYRPKAFAASARTIFMSIPMEADNCFGMVTAGYQTHVTDPGRLRVLGSISGESQLYEAQLKEGEVRYVKVEPVTAGLISLVVQFQDMSADAALPEIGAYRMISPCGP